MKKLYIIHGYGSGSTNNWFPWLKSEVEKLGVEVIVPDMPHSDAPQFSEWLSHIQDQVINPDEETFFVGHSLGCITIIQYLNNCNPDTRIGGAVFVAGFSSPIHLTELNSFFEIPLDNEKIKKVGGKLIAINSDDDPSVQYWQAEELENNLGAELHIVQGGKHLNVRAGFKEIPLLLELLKKIMNL